MVEETDDTRKKARKFAGGAFLAVFVGLSIEKFSFSTVDLTKIFENFQVALIVAFVVYLLVIITDFP